MAAESYSSDVLERYYGRIDEAIQSLPPELREIICKEYVAMKQRERAALGWNKIHEDILKQPFCYFMQQIVPTIICLDYLDCRFEGCCYPCLVGVKSRRRLHKVSMKPPMETIPNIEMRREYKNFLRICYDGWHEPCE